MTGANTLNSSNGVLTKFSIFPHAFSTDLSKAYRSVITGDQTNSIRRFFWFGDVNDPDSITEYVLTRMTFGDTPAAFILGEAIDIVAEHPGISEETRVFLKSGFYVDDGFLSSMATDKLERITNEFKGAFPEYSFKVKHILKTYMESSGITNTECVENMLGLAWDFVRDTLVLF